MLGLKLNHVSKRGHWNERSGTIYEIHISIVYLWQTYYLLCAYRIGDYWNAEYNLGYVYLYSAIRRSDKAHILVGLDTIQQEWGHHKISI